jgi:hypothetical protein
MSESTLKGAIAETGLGRTGASLDLPADPQRIRQIDLWSDEIDGVAAYCPDLKSCYWLPIELVACKSAIWLGLEPAANNQRAAINYAADHAFGAIAQLGERRHGMAEVVGSSPTSSTSSRPS